MSTFDYAGLRADTLETLVEFGNTLELTRSTGTGTYSPADGTFSGGSTTTLEGVGVLVGYSNREIDGSTILATDRKLIYQGDALKVGDVYGDYRVHQITEVDPDESGAVVTLAQMRT